jgi:hypothetical protein
VVEKIAAKTIKYLRKKGYLQEEGEEVLRPDFDPLFQDHPGLTEAMAASIQGKIAFGERAGQKVRRVGSGFGYEQETPLVKGTQCATVNGFNLHAKVGVALHARVGMYLIACGIGKMTTNCRYGVTWTPLPPVALRCKMDYASLRDMFGSGRPSCCRSAMKVLT